MFAEVTADPATREVRVRRLLGMFTVGHHIAAHADVPDIEADFVPDHEPDVPAGLKGVGEIGTAGTAAAIANAVWHATGRRQRTLPLRLDRVLEEEPDR